MSPHFGSHLHWSLQIDGTPFWSEQDSPGGSHVSPNSGSIFLLPHAPVVVVVVVIVQHSLNFSLSVLLLYSSIADGGHDCGDGVNMGIGFPHTYCLTWSQHGAKDGSPLTRSAIPGTHSRFPTQPVAVVVVVVVVVVSVVVVIGQQYGSFSKPIIICPVNPVIPDGNWSFGFSQLSVAKVELCTQSL